MRRSLAVGLLFAFALPLTACKSKRAVCEHARDRVEQLSVLDARMVEQDAADDQKAMAREFGEKITAATREGFVAPCLELDEAGHQCMVDIDKYADAMIAAQQGLLDCERQGGDCGEWSTAMDEARAAYGDTCMKVLEGVSSEALADLHL